MALLPVKVHVVAQRFDIGEGELLVADFGFLEANHVRLVFFDQRCQLMRPSAQAIDVERNDFHGRAVLRKTAMLAASVQWGKWTANVGSIQADGTVAALASSYSREVPQPKRRQGD